MNICFSASESIKIPIEEQIEIASLHRHLRQPQRLVNAIANPQLTKVISPEHYQLKMKTLNFMDIYQLQPIVLLRVWTGASGTLYLNSEDCEIKGIDYLQDRFSLNLKGKLRPKQINGQTYLTGKADLAVELELPPPLWLTPKPLLQLTGNALLQSVLLKIKNRLLSQLKSLCTSPTLDE